MLRTQKTVTIIVTIHRSCILSEYPYVIPFLPASCFVCFHHCFQRIVLLRTNPFRTNSPAPVSLEIRALDICHDDD